jgi:hypothetical protein
VEVTKAVMAAIGQYCFRKIPTYFQVRSNPYRRARIPLNGDGEMQSFKMETHILLFQWLAKAPVKLVMDQLRRMESSIIFQDEKQIHSQGLTSVDIASEQWDLWNE